MKHVEYNFAVNAKPKINNERVSTSLSLKKVETWVPGFIPKLPSTVSTVQSVPDSSSNSLGALRCNTGSQNLATPTLPNGCRQQPNHPRGRHHSRNHHTMNRSDGTVLGKPCFWALSSALYGVSKLSSRKLAGSV